MSEGAPDAVDDAAPATGTEPVPPAEPGTSALAVLDGEGGVEPDRDDDAPRGAEEVEAELRERLLGRLPRPDLWAWLGPAVVGLIALVLRLVHLGRPHELVFDETYYVKQAWSLLALGYEGRWSEGADEAFAVGDTSHLLPSADYVVHPPLGKWLIALGIRALGVDDSAGWRLSGAVAGAVMVVIVARLGRRLFRSTLLGCVAGLLLAIDGLHLVLSRTGILDIHLALFALAAFAAVVADRDLARARLARRLAQERAAGVVGDPWGPRLGMRWWLLAAGVLCGLASGVKWSGIYVLAVLGVLTVVWDLTARRAAGVRLWVGAGVIRDGVPSFLLLVPVAVLTYLGTWVSWFAGEDGYGRRWAFEHPELTNRWIPDALESWWHYHTQMWGFHTTLSSPHAYEAHAPGWVLQWRPTSFYWGDDVPQTCDAERCVQAITSVGNPIVWWVAVVGLVVLGYAVVRWRDWRAWTVLAGYAATWLPWLAFPNRTIFTFYAVALAPFAALATTYVVAVLLGWRPATAGGPDRALVARAAWREPGPWVAAVVLALAVAAAVFFWPVWTAAVIPYESWRWRMWLPTWV